MADREAFGNGPIGSFGGIERLGAVIPVQIGDHDSILWVEVPH